MADINSKATIDLQCNGQQVANTLQQLKQRAFDLENALAKAAAAGNKADVKKLERQLKQTHREIKAMSSAAEQADLVLRRLAKASPKELQQTLGTLQRQLKGIERGSSAWNEHIAKIKAVKAELAAVNAEMREGKGALENFNATFQKWQNAVMMGAAAVTGLVMAGRKAVQAYADIDAAMADTRKFTGMTAEQVTALNEKFKTMDTRTSREQLNLLAQEAGRLGKTSEEDIMGYVKAADILNVALSDLGAGATQTIAKITNIFGDEQIYGTEQALIKVGSVVNVLSQNCTASKPYLTEFAQRLAGVGAQAGLTVPQIMAFGAVLDANGQKVEMSATAISKLITDMFKNTSKICKATGMDVQEFSETLKRSTNEALIMLFDALKNKGDMSVLSTIFKDMGAEGARATQVLATLAGNIETVKQQQLVANDAFARGTSVGHEFDIQNNTVQAGLDKARKRVTELAVELGEKLAPVMKHVISSTTLILRFLSTLITFIGKHKNAIVSLTAALVTYKVAVNAATIAAKASAAAQALWNGVTKVGNALIGAARTAMLLMKAGYEMLTASSIRAYKAQVALNAAMKANPFMLIASVVAVATSAILNYSQRAKEAAKAEEEAKKQAEEFAKSISDISEASNAYVKDETARLAALYDAAINEALSKDERRKAAQRLLDLYPDYFKNMTAEDIMVGKAKQSYDELTKAIVKSARAKAAAAKMEENEGLLLDLEAQLERSQTRLDELNSPFHVSQLPKGVTDRPAEDLELANPDNLERGILEASIAMTNKKIEEIRKANEELAKKYGAVAILASPDGGSGNDTGGNNDEDDKNKQRFKQEKEWRAAMEAEAELAYYKGEKSYEEYQCALFDIQRQYAAKILARADLTAKEEAEARAESAEADYKEQKRWTEQEVRLYEDALRDQKAIVTQRYADGLIEKKVYDEAMRQLELEHLRNIISLYAEGTEERRKAQNAYDDAVMADRVKRRQAAEKAEEEARRKAEQAEKKHQEELKKIRKGYFGQFYADDEYKKELSLLQEVYRSELALCQNNAERKLEVEKAYQIALYAMRQKWAKKGSKQAKNDLPNSFKTAIMDSVEWLNSDGGKALTQSFSTIVNGMSDLFSGISDMVQADLEIESAAIEARYQNEVSAAEGNMYKVKQIEAKKQKDLADAKNKANRKMFAMQVIQAIAQTATSALNAYSSAAAIPVVGWIMGPIAAAMATAAGMLQVAALKKQQQASNATGYWRGGYTPKGNKYQPVGTVHAGEWVASQEMLASPVARPVIDVLDYAQRTNTIGSLRSEDVASPAFQSARTAAATTTTAATPPAPPVVNVPPAQVTVAQDQQLTSTLSLLQQRLNEPFVTINTVAGDMGIAKAQEEYEQLMRNKTPKSRR